MTWINQSLTISMHNIGGLDTVSYAVLKSNETLRKCSRDMNENRQIPLVFLPRGGVILLRLLEEIKSTVFSS